MLISFAAPFGNLSWNAAEHIHRQIVFALAFAYRTGFVHDGTGIEN
jgi:hypothetical protein